MSGLLWLLCGATAAAAVAVLLSLWQRRRLAVRVRQLTGYLEAASCGRETTLARGEDALSLLEDELYKTVSELRIAKEQAQKERRQQADNLADIAHQLKTPLTSMSLMTQLLTEGADEPQRDCLGRIDNQLARLDRLTGALLTMSRLDAGAIVFAPVPLPFGELAARATEPLEQLLHTRGQTVAVTGDEVILACDATWTTEALVNLLKNCSEHAPAGGQLGLGCSATPLYTQLVVQDNGPGFDPGELTRVFQRFYRGQNAAKESIGIGLALARAMVEGQGGMIRAENRPEGGARFVIRFYA